MKNKKFAFKAIDILFILGLFALVFVADRFLPTYDIKFKVLQKGAVFALVAVSMNLLNGFTGLFSSTSSVRPSSTAAAKASRSTPGFRPDTKVAPGSAASTYHISVLPTSCSSRAA